MKIALAHFRVYETDGVSLEMDKWKISLMKMGHEVVYLSGSKSRDNDIYLEYLDYRADYNNKIHENAFNSLNDFSSKEELLDYIDKYRKLIYKELCSIINDHSIDLIVPNNISSLGFNLPVGMAFADLDRNNVVQIINQNHDFHWERERYSTPLFPEIQEYLDTYFPYKGRAKNCTINKIAQAELENRKDIEANVVPNVFDFARPSWITDDYNKDLRHTLGISENDIVFLQATRIVERKAIELGHKIVEIINSMLPLYEGERLYNGAIANKDTKIHFVLAGQNELDEKKYATLQKQLASGQVQVHYISDIVNHSRGKKNGAKVYSLWDIYTMSDFITYTSVLEGWGNQLLEGIFAMKPILIYEYPVFKSDIKEANFSLVSIDGSLRKDRFTKLFSVSEDVSKKAATEIINLLFDGDSYFDIVGCNFEKGKKTYSYDNLYNILSKIFPAA